MNKELKELLRSLSLNTAPVSVFCAEEPSDSINKGNGFRSLCEAVNAVDLAEITVQNTIGMQVAWYLVSASEGIIDSSK